MKTLLILLLLTMPCYATAPPVPINVKAVDITQTGFKLSWDPSSGAYAYRIIGLQQPWTQVYSTNSYTKTGAMPDSSYTVTIQAMNIGQELSGKSAPIVIKTLPLPNSIPACPRYHIERITAPLDVYVRDTDCP